MAEEDSVAPVLDKEDSIDPILDKLLDNMTQMSQVQYSTKDQLAYLCRFALKLGLYDAADVVKRLHDQALNPIGSHLPNHGIKDLIVLKKSDIPPLNHDPK